MTTATAETREFQTEVRELLQLMIHSLYSNKEIFVRELVSNAADALDKLRFLAIQNPEWLAGAPDLRIDIAADEKAGTLTFEDNGVGMNKEDLISNLGTIARSGTKAFLKNLGTDSKKDLSLIGQFGVGFYSVFMVASKVEVHTRRAGEMEGWLWTSEGTGEYTLEEREKATRGTKIVIHLKDEDDCKEFSHSWKVDSIVRKYSEFVTHPIYMADEDKDKEPKRLNEKQALWRRSAKDVEEEQHKEFFKHLSWDGGDPLAWSHTHVEGTQEFWSLLYIPSKAPHGLFHNERSHGLKLHVKRVFIMDDCKELLPTWLRFVRGVVDSEDLPLNVSREILQSNKVVEQIRKHVVKKVLDTLKDLAENKPEQYRTFWKELGQVLKEGFYMNWEHLDELKALLRFGSTHMEGENMTSLKDYVSRMRDEQKEIYCITGENRKAVTGSPHLEAFRSKGIEVLFLTDPIDEFMLQSLTEFDGKKIRNITRGDVELEKSKEEEKNEKEQKKTFEALCTELQKALDESVKEVRISSRLHDSPVCLVTSEEGMSPQMERIMQATGQGFQKSKRIMEINPAHAICKDLNQRLERGEGLGEWPVVLHGQALLAEGSPLTEPAAYVKAVTNLLVR